MRTVPILAFCLSLATTGQAQQERHARVKVYTHTVPDGMASLASLGIAVDHGEVKEGLWFTTDLSITEIEYVARAGFAYDILIDDVQAFYVDQNASKAARSTERSSCDNGLTYPTPTNFGPGSMGGYYTWEEMLDILDAMHALYPELISAKEAIGNSHEGRPIHFVRISNAPTEDQDKPEVFYNALHHAREPASLSQLLFFMWHLLENYGSDAEVTHLVDELEFYFVPCVNPDGYVYNATIAPEGGGMWRKNRRNNDDGSFGVDLNRNYAMGWGFDNSGSSPDPSSQVYRGTAPFSEPETQVLRDFCEAHEFRLTLNNHTYGNLLIYPWGFLPSTYTPDSALFATYGALLTRNNGYRHGTSDQTVNYQVNGGSDDWMYGEQESKPKIMAMTPEAGAPQDGFWPAAWRITDICSSSMAQNLFTAHLAGRYAQAVDRSPSLFDQEEGHLRFQLTRLGQEPGTFTVFLEPLDNVASVGPPLVFANMELLEARTDSIAITLPNGLAPGATFVVVLALDLNGFVQRDTITKVFGAPNVVLADAGNSMDNWQFSAWGPTPFTWFSPPSSITDSPLGNYPNGVDHSLLLEEPLDLSNATAARLRFMARWDIESLYDHAQVLASADGAVWTPICGRYTRQGSEYQDPGEPVYDGWQGEWVEEEMVLDDFLGGPVWLRFRMVTDNWVSRDGFYFDDLTVTITNDGGTGMHTSGTVVAAPRAMPNPAHDHCWIAWPGIAMDNAVLEVHNALGALVRTVPMGRRQGSVRLDTSDLASGIYTCRVPGATGTMQTLRLVVAKD